MQSSINVEPQNYLRTTELPVSSLLIQHPFRPGRNYEFPKTLIGDRERSFQASWFLPPPDGFNWLHYRVCDNTVVCYICANQELKGNLKSCTKKESAFITSSFSNWKEATKKFTTHEKSECHRCALTHEITVPKCGDIIEMTQDSREGEQAYLMKIMECVQFLGKQGIAFQGHSSDTDNFTQLLLLCGKDDVSILKRLQSTGGKLKSKYTHEFQNELLDIMAKQILAMKLKDIKKSPYFAIMADEYTDVANKEHVSTCVRWIEPKTLVVHEDFLGFYEVPNIKSVTIKNVIIDALTRFQLSLSQLHGQTYDGASNMLGRKSGVAALIKQLQPKAFDTHCHGHSLNLSVKDMTLQVSILKNTIGTVGEICILVKFSPKRENIFRNLQQNVIGDFSDLEKGHQAMTLDKLCPTRWTVRGKCDKKIIGTYNALFELWRHTWDEGRLTTDVKARIIGCYNQMRKFDFYFGLHLGQKFYSLTESITSTATK